MSDEAKRQCEDRLIQYFQGSDLAWPIRCGLEQGHSGEWHGKRIVGERTLEMRWSLTQAQREVHELRAKLAEASKPMKRSKAVKT